MLKRQFQSNRVNCKGVSDGGGQRLSILHYSLWQPVNQYETSAMNGDLKAKLSEELQWQNGSH